MANWLAYRCELDIKYERPLLPFLPVRFDNLEIAETVNSNTVTTIGELGTTMTTEVPLSEISTNVQDQLSNMELNQTEQFHVVHAAPIMKKVKLAIIVYKLAARWQSKFACLDDISIERSIFSFRSIPVHSGPLIYDSCRSNILPFRFFHSFDSLLLEHFS